MSKKLRRIGCTRRAYHKYLVEEWGFTRFWKHYKPMAPEEYFTRKKKEG